MPEKVTLLRSCCASPHGVHVKRVSIYIAIQSINMCRLLRLKIARLFALSVICTSVAIVPVFGTSMQPHPTWHLVITSVHALAGHSPARSWLYRV